MRITHKALGTLAALLLAAAFVGCVDSTSDRTSLSVGSGSGSNTSDNCTYTQGYWKTHPDAWPVSSLTLGSVTYTEQELLAILWEPVKGNGLISLAHQLIAAKLNIASGASDTSIATTIQQADALIGSLVVPPVGDGYLAPSATSSLTDMLDEFNSGIIGPGHCGENGGGGCDGGMCPPPGPVCGNGVVESGEDCDDGNTSSGDGCSSTCQCEPVAVCGNGVVESGEECDDGNTSSGDGCSSVCLCETSLQ
jgi:cysteine-rich repeat protein